LNDVSSGYVLEHDSSGPGRWLRRRRLKLALGIAGVEAVLAAFTHDVSRLTIVLLALVFIPIYFIWGQKQGDTVRQVTWIAAASQSLAVVAAIIAYLVGLLVLVVAAVFAVVALVLILSDRR
jgi:hypothetical protein